MEEVDKKFNFWIGQFPESYHSLDMRRFYEFVELAYSVDTGLHGDWLKEKIAEKEHKMTAEQVDDYVCKFDAVFSYLRYKEVF